VVAAVSRAGRAAASAEGAPPARPAGSTPLPARDRVADVQRSRLVSAMMDVACSRGAANVTVAHVVARAGVSRRTFYELFADCQDCLDAAIEQALERARGHVRNAYDPQAQWRVRIRAGLEAFLAFLEDEPSMGRLLIVESLSAGPRALARRSAALAPIMSEIDSARSQARGGRGLSPLTAEGLAGSVLSVLHTRMLSEPREPLLELASPLTAMIVLPYLGPAAARRELSQRVPKLTRQDTATAEQAQLNDLPMRLTYRTMVVLGAIASQPGASNRQIADLAGISDQGQASKLLRRLEQRGLIANAQQDHSRGLSNVWTLTPRGAEMQRAMSPHTAGG
jgi:AcrR family transcriptional regulator